VQESFWPKRNKQQQQYQNHVFTKNVAVFEIYNNNNGGSGLDAAMHKAVFSLYLSSPLDWLLGCEQILVILLYDMLG
jgi:hypothetical protein